MPQTPFMKDLDDLKVLSKNEHGFLKVIVLPLFENLTSYYEDGPVIRKLKGHIEKNMEKWKSIHDEFNSS